MPGQVIGKRLQQGYPGSPTRSSDIVVLNRVCVGELPFGAPVFLNPDNTVKQFGSDGADARFMGFAVRIVKEQQSIFETVGGYRDGELADVLTRGSISVPFKGTGTPTAGGSVYIRIAANASLPSAEIGDVEAAADGTNTVLISNARFTTGQTDDHGIIEVTVTERRV